MPVRTALMRLETEGLVHQLPRRGAVVAPLSVSDFEEIQALRAGIEGLAARRGAPLMTDADLQAAAKTVVRLRAMATDGRLSEYVRLTEELHDICYRAAGRPRLMQLIDAHRRPAERYIRLVIKASPNFHDSLERIQRFFDACKRRDGEVAETALREALEASVRQVALLVPPTSDSENVGLARTGTFAR